MILCVFGYGLYSTQATALSVETEIRILVHSNRDLTVLERRVLFVHHTFADIRPRAPVQVRLFVFFYFFIVTFIASSEFGKRRHTVYTIIIIHLRIKKRVVAVECVRPAAIRTRHGGRIFYSNRARAHTHNTHTLHRGRVSICMQVGDNIIILLLL